MDPQNAHQVRDTPTLGYEIHGVEVQVSTDQPPLREAIERLLGHFAKESVDSAALHLRCQPVEGPLPLGEVVGGQPIHDACQGEPSATDASSAEQLEGHRIYRLPTGEIALECPGRALVRPRRRGRSCELLVIAAEAQHPNVLAGLVQLAVSELLKLADLFPVRAGAVEWRDKGMLFPGTGGDGKTTGSLTMARDGGRFLADDLALVREREGVVEILPLVLAADVHRDGERFFPELFDHATDPLDTAEKRRLPMTGSDDTSPSRANVLLFPQIEQGGNCRLQPLSSTAAMTRLLPASLCLADPETTRRHFQVVSNLANQSKGFRLTLGDDLDKLPELIAGHLGINLEAE